MVSILDVAFPWPPVMAAHDSNRLPTALHNNGITVSRKPIITRRTRLCSSGHTISFRLRWRQFPIKIAFAMTITWAQGQLKERVMTYLACPVFPTSRCMRDFSDPLHLTTLLLQLLKDIVNLENYGMITSNITYREILQRLKYINRSLLIKYSVCLLWNHA